MILELNRKQDVFSGIDEIYIDDIIEIDKAPKKAALLHYESIHQDGQSKIGTTLLTSRKGLTAYGWCPGGKEEEYEKDQHDVDPFIVFDS